MPRVLKEKIQYIDIATLLNSRYPFEIFMGGRGVGKTYSALRYAINQSRDNGRKFLFSRRQKTDLEELADNSIMKTELGNPFAYLNQDYGWKYGIKFISDKQAGIFWRDRTENDGFLYSDQIGYAAALTSFGRIKGAAYPDCDLWIIDEFVPEPHIPFIKSEGELMARAYETIARNRELKGIPPLKVIMLSNSENIYIPLLKTLGIVSDVEKMIRSGKEVRYWPSRGLSFHMLKTPDSLEKAREQTALSRLMKGTSYYDMAYGNQFSYNDFSGVKYQKIVGYRPFVAIDEAYIWKKKGSSEFYVSYASAVCEHFNEKIESDLLSFKRRAGIYLQEAYISGKILFESYALKRKILDIIFGK